MISSAFFSRSDIGRCSKGSNAGKASLAAGVASRGAGALAGSWRWGTMGSKAEGGMQEDSCVLDPAEGWH